MTGPDWDRPHHDPSHGDSHNRVELRADPRILIRELALVLAVSSAFIVIGVLASDDGVDWAWVAIVWSVFVAVFATFGTFPWWWRYRHVRVEATRDHIRVSRGDTTLLDEEAAAVIQVRVRGRTDWHSLMWPHNTHPGPFPVLVVWTDTQRFESPPLRIWKKPLALWNETSPAFSCFDPRRTMRESRRGRLTDRLIADGPDGLLLTSRAARQCRSHRLS